MAKVTLQTGSTQRGEAQYVKFAENILVKLTENAAMFDDVTPALADLEEALASLKQAQADAAYGDRRFVLIKNQAFRALKEVVYQLSLYVESKARGDASVILAAGFNPSKTRGANSLAPAPKPKYFSMDVNVHVPGMIVLKTNFWKGVLAYQFEYRKKDSAEDWTRVVSSRSKLTLSGLASVQQYEFRVAYIGRNPQITYSDVLTSYVF